MSLEEIVREFAVIDQEFKRDPDAALISYRILSAKMLRLGPYAQLAVA